MKTMALTDDAILEAAETIGSGGTVVFPTETSYALGADPFNAVAVSRVFALKGRDVNKPLGLIAASRGQVEKLCIVGEVESRLINRYWPGPLSIVLPLQIPSGSEREALMRTSAGWDTVSIRVSGNMWARKLAETVGHPIIATSANKSGSPSCFTMTELAANFFHDRQPDVVLDGGELPRRPVSTLVAIRDGHVVVLRDGAIRIHTEE